MLGASLVIAHLVLGAFFYSLRTSDDIVAVVGSATKCSTFDTDGYGMYNTETRRKDITVTVRATFKIT
jgi:hypothetical protein